MSNGFEMLAGKTVFLKNANLRSGHPDTLDARYPNYSMQMAYEGEVIVLTNVQVRFPAEVGEPIHISGSRIRHKSCSTWFDHAHGLCPYPNMISEEDLPLIEERWIEKTTVPLSWIVRLGKRLGFKVEPPEVCYKVIENRTVVTLKEREPYELKVFGDFHFIPPEVLHFVAGVQ